MKKVLFIIIGFFSSIDVFANPIACPVCTVVIASGLGVSRFLGISDYVVGIWLGALLLAVSNGIVNYLKNKKIINNKFLNFAIYILDYATLIPLYVGKNPQIAFNSKKILSIDAFLFSIIVGSLTLFCSSKLYYKMKENNGGKAHFPFEKVVLPVVALLIISILFHFFVF